jgi:OOP family OmpA-OmpF porin
VRAHVLVAVAIRLALGGALAAVAPATARGEPQLELGWFGKRSALGDSWAPDQVPGTAPVVGARAGWVALPALPGDLALALEAELAFAPAFTGESLGDGRTMYFAPVFEWRGQAVLRLARWRVLVPHLVLGAGGDSVASRSPFMANDTDPIAYWGAGLTAPAAHGWQLRLDVHQGIMPARNGGMHATAEVELGLAMAFGATVRPPHHEPAPAAPAAISSAAPGRALRDDVPAALAPCPGQAARDAAGACPPLDADGDGITGDADRCPDQAEDRDGFQDEDGCPDPDNDGDGIADAQDTCPDQPETVNGWQDGDGCPDELPGDVAAALATTVRFAPGHARVTEASSAPLRAVRAMLEHHAELRIAIIGHPERAGGEDLARRRADAVKWYLVDLGIPEDQIVTRVGAVTGAPAITLQLAPASPAAAPP